MYKGRRVPGRMMRGEREIALTTPVSLTAFQPSLGRIISLTVPAPKELSGLATITGPYGTKLELAVRWRLVHSGPEPGLERRLGHDPEYPNQTVGLERIPKPIARTEQ
jgi:hypothetical protein